MIEQPYTPVPVDSFLRFCETLQIIAETRSNNDKISIFASYLKQLEMETDIRLASQFPGEGAFSRISEKRVSIGHRTVSRAVSAFCEIDYEQVFKPSRTALGSTSETMEKLMTNIPEAAGKRKPVPFGLSDIEQHFLKLEQTRKREEKEKLLMDIWTKLTGIEIKYLFRIMGQGSLRIGFESKSIVAAIASAFEQDVEKVRYVHMITGSLGEAAVLAKRDELDRAGFEMFQPLSFMLASPLDHIPDVDLSEYVAEEKFDGMRCQAHINESRVALYSRDMNDITHIFPEITETFLDKKLTDTVLDGEICIYKHNTIRPFSELQKRMGLKNPSDEIIRQYPVIFIAYDVLYVNKAPVFDRKVPERRKMLEALCAEHRIAITRQFDPQNERHLEERFNQALGHGNEGLMLKKINSAYEYGQRGKSWLKVKRPGGSIDTVIMYATTGSGKRGGLYSDFTLGIRVKDDERYEEEFIPIGKAYSGYTDAELKDLNYRIKALVVERFGPTLSLKPNIVVEIEFDSIQVNRRTKAGYTLRFPRFKAIRWDLNPDDADTLKDVERMYHNKLDAYRKEQDESSSFII